MHLSQEGYCALMALFRLIEPKVSTGGAVMGSCPGTVVTACHVRVAGSVFVVTADRC